MRKGSASLLAIAAAAGTTAPALAQDVRPATDTPNVEPTAPPPDTVDPDEPLAPLPGLDVEWPEFSDEGDDSDIVVEADGTIDYDWTITGLPAEVDSQIEAAFKLASALEAGDGDALNSTQIDLRARTDVTLLDTILRSEGYYGATIEPIISAADDARSILVTMEVDSGPRYVFIDVNLPGIDAAGEVEADLRDAYGIEAGDPVVAADVVAAEVELRSKLGEEGFAQAEIGERTVVVDHKERTASLTLPVDPGPVASFGNIIVEGQPPFPPDHVQTLARFDRGDTFKRSLVEDLRRALVATGLVTAATVDPEPSEDGETVDLRIVLTPAPPRTIAGNVGYSTGEGFRAEASWEHRNLINPEGAFQARAVLGTQEQLGSVGLRFNNWKVRDQSLSFSALVGAIDRPAYEANTVILTAGIERTSTFIWQKPWTYSAGIELIATDEADGFRFDEKPPLLPEAPDPEVPEVDQTRSTYFIAALPLELRYDGSNDLLDPTDGFRLGGFVSPEISLESSESLYVRSQIDASAYYPVNDQLVIAGRARFATISGIERDFVAPSRRLYGGGGGSVRGYEYQAIGPRDEVFNVPLGGRSLTEFSLEARYRFGSLNQFGVVPFIDVGRVSEDPWPGTNEFRVGVGIGARYYSNFGPIRIDIGTPLNGDDDDPPIAVVVSLGQAF